MIDPIISLEYIEQKQWQKANHENIQDLSGFTRPQEYYFTTAAWISPTEVCITWLNRFQNLSVVSICKSPLWKCQEIQKIISDDHGWVDTPSEPPIFSNNGSSYIATAPVKDGPSGCYRHIVWVNILKRQVIPLTHGKLEVVKILAWDQTNNI
ncbi:inactive dipeptidyl peptidase 10-like, partial [Copidosoma floridanum]|uniref:inactive dipeptidyl peptidase 10-like n=1 Tax=Copidosoma floridanum TaxID=29053 RepID=UPI000C6F728B